LWEKDIATALAAGKAAFPAARATSKEELIIALGRLMEAYKARAHEMDQRISAEI
jgi:hypothetical protein